MSIAKAIKKGGAAYGQLKSLLKRKDLNIRIKKLMLNQLIRPAMLYGSEIWNPYSSEIEQLDILERKFIRTMTDIFRDDRKKWYSNKILYDTLGVKGGVSELIKERREKFELRMENHLNLEYRGRVLELLKRENEMNERNREYEATKMLWKSLKPPKKGKKKKKVKKKGGKRKTKHKGVQVYYSVYIFFLSLYMTPQTIDQSQ